MSGKNSFRIIAGQWGSRKLGFYPVKDLRPTTDRIRETLFNWLMPVLPGARCLDLFAGSGALGFEAASRGAGQVELVEQHAKAYQALQDNIKLLAADNISVCRHDALKFLGQNDTEKSFDIVFLDPPYRLELLQSCTALLQENNWLSPKAYIYLEHSRQQNFTAPDDWQCDKSKTAGNVVYALYKHG